MQTLSDKQKEQIKQLLTEQLSELDHQLAENDHYGLKSSLGDTTGELSSYDNHPADLGSELYERGKDIALNELTERRVTETKKALSMLETDEYGRCSVCGAPIPFERLMAVPTTLYCKTHAPQKHVSEQRPIEELTLTPPFGRTSLDERSDQNGFDGEDAWQIVEQWGTSNTPALAEQREIENYDEMAIESDENDGYVEDFESFLATDIYGRHVTVVRNKDYRNYMEQGEGDPLLEPEEGTAGEE